jgi:hypothetical protein
MAMEAAAPFIDLNAGNYLTYELGVRLLKQRFFVFYFSMASTARPHANVVNIMQFRYKRRFPSKEQAVGGTRTTMSSGHKDSNSSMLVATH